MWQSHSSVLVDISTDARPPSPSPRSSRAPSPKRQRRRIVLVSFIDSGGGNTVGIMYGALSRLCYARMWGYHSVVYSDKDLAGWVPPTAQRRHRLYESDEELHRRWSKNFMIRRAFVEFNLTERDWVFWLDADTIITQPNIRVEEIVANASTRYRFPGDGALTTAEPDMVVADSFNGINNGVLGMRPTRWSFDFLESWWQDQNANRHAGDNGPFIHSVLRELAAGAGIEYNNECHMRTSDAYADFGALSECYERYLRKVVCRGDVARCVSRCPHFDRPYGTLRDDSSWQPGAVELGGWQHCYLTRYSRHIAGHCRINTGEAWSPIALWTEQVWLLHLAGRDREDRNQTMQRYAERVAGRFSPRCF